MVKISPSILSCDFSNLEKEIKSLDAAGADFIHIDVMDGHYVPNLTFGPSVIKSIRKHTHLPFDVHLMIDQPEKYIQDYVNSGANIITIHPESTKHLHRTIDLIKQNNVLAGVALLPDSIIEPLKYIIDYIDLILVMTVNPGFSGQRFIYNQLGKIKELSDITKQKNITLAVDGGINEDTAKLCIEAGADMLISGSYIFKNNYKKQIDRLKNG